MDRTLVPQDRAVHFTSLSLALVLAGALLGGCSPRMSTDGSSAYMPQTGSASGPVVLNARPGMQSIPPGASTAGSRIGGM